MFRAEPIFNFRLFQFDPNPPVLTYRSRTVELAPKALEILAVLIRNAGHVVCKDDLLNLVWPHTIVEEGNLAVYVSSLRKALAEHDREVEFIETVPKRGYRFVAQVQQQIGVGTTTRGGLTAQFRIAEHYLQQNTAAGCRRAGEIYEKCIRADHWSAKARAGLADSLLWRSVRRDLSTDEAVSRALKVLGEAKAIQADCADVHFSLSRVYSVWHWDWQKADDELLYGLELATDAKTKLLGQTWSGVYRARLGDLDPALQELRQVTLQLPLYPLVWFFLADAYLIGGDFTSAAAVSMEALELHPNSWVLHALAGRVLAMVSEYSEALRHLRLARLLCPEQKSTLLAAIAYVHAAAGHGDRAARLLSSISAPSAGQKPSFISAAVVHAALGDKDRALDDIESACAEHDWQIAGLKRDCCLDLLRTDRRFQTMICRVGLDSERV